jgi:hypothetical protein
MKAIIFLISLIQTVFLVLKISGYIHWGWLVVLIPEMILIVVMAFGSAFIRPRFND